jgi:uncharacterized protein
MQIPPSTGLTEAQIDQLEEFFDSTESAMSLEQVDGFFCALISGPDFIPPSEYLPYLFGEEMPDIGPGTQASKIIGLLFQHWDHIAETLLRDEVYYPILFEDETGKCQANEWADGYMLGVKLQLDSWSELMLDEKKNGHMIPVMALHFERDDDPEFRSGPIADKEREDIIARMIAAILEIYRYFAPARIQGAVLQPVHQGHSTIGRNDPCYCGSGKKYKHCHGGGVTLH